MSILVEAKVFFLVNLVLAHVLCQASGLLESPSNKERNRAVLQMNKVELDTRPNFVVLFADDIGWGDLGANWKPNEVVTPNLNHLAEEGLRLTDFHAGASICTPSRASLLTGRLGLRSGVYSNFNPNSVGGLPLNETTLAEALHGDGYTTGMIGKWHLGITEKFHPRSRGFQYYYGLPYSNDMGCVDVPVYNKPKQKQCPTNKTDAWFGGALPLYENYDIVEQPADLIQLGDHYSNKATEFLTTASKLSKPFFLYVAFAHMHAPLSHAARFDNSTSLGTVYSDTLHEMDDIIGRVVKELKRLDFYKNTLIWFTGDNGPWEGKCEFSGNLGPFLGQWQKDTQGGGAVGKCTTWEGGHREPTVVVWPGHIKANQTNDALTSALDVFPTLLSIAGIALPKWRRYDGIDLSLFFEGKTSTAHYSLFHPNSGDTAPIGEIDTVRMGPWKILWKSGGTWAACDGSLAPLTVHDPPLLFNVVDDPAESIALTRESFQDYDEVLNDATALRKDLLESIKSDNTTIADYSVSKDVIPCCDPSQYYCRCKRD